MILALIFRKCCCCHTAIFCLGAIYSKLFSLGSLSISFSMLLRSIFGFLSQVRALYKLASASQ